MSLAQAVPQRIFLPASLVEERGKYTIESTDKKSDVSTAQAKASRMNV